MRFVIFILYLFVSISLAKDIDMKVSYFITDKENLPLKEVKQKSFHPLKDESLNRGLDKNIFWLKVLLKNNTTEKKESILELQNPSIDHIRLYSDKVFITGDHEKYGTRDIDAINFAFSIKIEPKQTKVVYIMLKSKNAVTIPIKIYSKESFLKKEMLLNRGLFLFLGFMLALLIYNSYMYLLLKEKPYLYYVLFEFVYVGLLISISGLGSSFLWRDSIFINELTHKYFDDLSIIFFMMFILSFLQIKRYFPYFYKIAQIFLILNAILMISSGGYLHDILVKPVMLSSIAYIMFIIYLSVKHQIAYARYILVGATLLTIGSLSTLLKNFGWVEINFFTTWAIYICAILEGMLFSFVIVKKIERIKEHDRKLQIYQKERLEREVKRQTANLNLLLQEVNHRVKNNLQIISSFISFALQSSKEKRLLESLNQRVHTISLLHETLYRSRDFEKIDIHHYIKNIIKDIYKIYSPKCKLSIDIKHIEFDFDKSMTIGLIVNEIITNVLLHSNASKLKIELIYKDGSYILSIEDNGVGFEESFGYKTLGMKLIKRLVKRKLNGDIEIKSSQNGSSFIITFR